MTDICVVADSYIDLDDRLVKAIQTLEKIYQDIPKEFRDKAVLELESDYDSSSCNATVRYYRPPTIEEQRAQEANEARYANIRNAQEFAMYERLKAKFGD